MLPILYSFRRCPYAMRARYMIALLNTTVELREVILKAKPSALLELGGRSTVPQLVDVDGKRYPESLDILFWSLSKARDKSLSVKLWPEAAVKQSKIKAWINYNDASFKYWLDRYKYADRHLDYTEEYYRQKGEVFLTRLEKRLAHSNYLLGEEMTIADVAIFPFIRQFVGVNPKWFDNSEYHYLKIWLERFINSDVFNKTVMPKFTAWEEGQKEVVFPE